MLKKYFSAINRLIQILDKKQKMLGIMVFCCAIIAAILETLGVSIIVPLVSSILNPEELARSSYALLIMNVLHISNPDTLVGLFFVLIIFVYIAKNLFFSFNAWVRVKYACKIQRECSILVMKSYMSRGYSFFSMHNASELTEGVTADITLLYSIILNIMQSVSQMLIVFFICIYMCISDWQIAISVVFSAIVCLGLIYFVFRKQMVKAGYEQRKYHIISRKYLLEAFYGIKEVIVMRKQQFYIDEYEKNTTKYQSAYARQTVGAELPAYVIEAISICSILIIMYFRMRSLEDPQSFVAILASFAVGAFRVLPALGKISSSTNIISAAAVGLDSVYYNIVEARDSFIQSNIVDIADKECANGLSFSKSLAIRDICFSYETADRLILDNLSLSIDKGSSVAFIGESGAGKTTLADIILGVLIPQSGEILVDGINIREIPNKWSEIVGFVPQSIYLADATLKENVAFGQLSEEINESRVVDALNKANLLKFVETLPDGLNTEVGEGGIRLSGGQRQRLGIARALYRCPEILILDEATSALDSETEKAVMEAVDSLHGKMTLVIIAHRLTTVKNCDYIYEIKNGKAVERLYEDLV